MVVASLATCFANHAVSQGTFRNLDFELAQVSPLAPPGTPLTAAAGIPLWTAYAGGVEQSSILYNALYIGDLGVALLSSGPLDPYGSAVIQGNFTVVLQAGAGGSGNTTISQTGLIPANALALLFTASMPYGAGWTVSIGSQTIPVVELHQINSYYALYGADMSSFAGRSETLSFTALTGLGPPVNMYLDAIQFSSTPVPEPSAFALAALGALGLARFRKGGS